MIGVFQLLEISKGLRVGCDRSIDVVTRPMDLESRRRARNLGLEALVGEVVRESHLFSHLHEKDQSLITDRIATKGARGEPRDPVAGRLRKADSWLAGSERQISPERVRGEAAIVGHLIREQPYRSSVLFGMPALKAGRPQGVGRDVLPWNKSSVRACSARWTAGYVHLTSVATRRVAEGGRRLNLERVSSSRENWEFGLQATP